MQMFQNEIFQFLNKMSRIQIQNSKKKITKISKLLKRKIYFSTEIILIDIHFRNIHKTSMNRQNIFQSSYILFFLKKTKTNISKLVFST